MTDTKKEENFIIKVTENPLVQVTNSIAITNKILREHETRIQVAEYKSVRIGNQVWMAENLKVDTFRNGEPIPHAKSSEEWVRAGENKEPAWCYYDNDPENGKIYGKLYNWYAVNDPRGLAPKGWRIPSENEFKLLLLNLGNDEFQRYNALKEGGSSGFNTLLGGFRVSIGNFCDVERMGTWWSSSENDTKNSWWLGMLSDKHGAYLGISLKEWGLSFRCLIDKFHETRIEVTEYKSVTIGNQVWMAENLNVDTFQNGEPIPYAETEDEWELAGLNEQPAWCYYDNNPENGKIYGKLYNWYAVNDPRGLASKGWRIPSEKEFRLLLLNVGNDKFQRYNALEEGGTSGFNALYGGWRGSAGGFYDVEDGGWWSSSENETGLAWTLRRNSSFQCADVFNYFKENGFSVRCLHELDYL